jgi:hypothetical protein
MQFILPNGTPQQAGFPPLALQRYNLFFIPPSFSINYFAFSLKSGQFLI